MKAIKLTKTTKNGIDIILEIEKYDFHFEIITKNIVFDSNQPTGFYEDGRKVNNPIINGNQLTLKSGELKRIGTYPVFVINNGKREQITLTGMWMFNNKSYFLDDVRDFQKFYYEYHKRGDLGIKKLEINE
jgi:hypothetical protein